MVPTDISSLRAFRTLGLALALVAGCVATDAMAGGRICTSDDTFMFGNRAVGSSTTAAATVSNCGDAPWSFTDASVHPATGPAFQVSSTCTTGLTLAPGAACTVGVRFAPVTPGQTSGGFWLHNTTTVPDQLITFYGRGIDTQSGSASLVFGPASAVFASQSVGSQSPELAVELHNPGPAALTLSALVFNGPEAHDFFGYSYGCYVGVTIAAGDFCTMSLFFRPQAAGLRRGYLVIDSPQLPSLAIMQMSGTGSAIPSTPTVDVIEYYHAATDHYFMSSLAADIDALDSSRLPGWVRTGRSFKAYPQPVDGASPVCRFYLPAPLDSHFYSASPAECSIVKQTYPSFVFEAPDVFFIPLPDTASGACPFGTAPVYRLYNNRADTNHRYTTDPQIKAQMISMGYIAEGYGPGTTMCAPQ